MPVIKLTPDFIENNLTCPPDKRKIEYVDTGGIGFYIAVQQTSQGTGTYYLRYKNSDGKTCHQKIGKSDTVSLVDARSKAKQLKSEITLGADPSAEANAKKAIPTYSDFMLNQYMPYVKSRKRSWKKDESLLRCHILDVFGTKKLQNINKFQVQQFHTMLREEKGLSAAQCDHNLKLMRHSLNLAVDWEIIDKNPIARIKLYKEDNKVENYLDEQQLKQLLHVLHTDHNRVICNVALLLLSSGMRLNEILSLTWRNCNRESRVIRVDSINSKAGRVRSISMNDSAEAVLDSLDTEGRYEYLFINPRTGLRLKNIHKTWDRLRCSAGLPHLRLHDLRHSAASMMVNSGVSIYTVSKVLGHSTVLVSERYSHLNKKTLQAATDSISACMNDAMQATA